MLSFFRQHKNKLLLVLIVILVLAAAYIFTEKPQTVPSSVKESVAASSNDMAFSSANTSFPAAVTSSKEESARSVSLSSAESTVSAEEPHTVEPSSEPISEESSVRPEIPSVTSVQDTLPEESSAEPIQDIPVSLPEKSSAEPIQDIPVSLPEESSAADVSEEPLAMPSAEPSSIPSSPSCTFSISCAVLTDRIDDLPKNKRFLVPADGILSAPCSVTIKDGESVFDVTKRICQAQKIPFEFTMTPVYHTAYIEGIANLYEFDCGSASGWVYTVNGVQPGVGCSDYPVHDGDIVVWHYTCALGNDVN